MNLNKLFSPRCRRKSSVISRPLPTCKQLNDTFTFADKVGFRMSSVCTTERKSSRILSFPCRVSCVVEHFGRPPGICSVRHGLTRSLVEDSQSVLPSFNPSVAFAVFALGIVRVCSFNFSKTAPGSSHWWCRFCGFASGV